MKGVEHKDGMTIIDMSKLSFNREKEFLQQMYVELGGEGPVEEFIDKGEITKTWQQMTVEERERWLQVKRYQGAGDNPGPRICQHKPI